MQIPVKVKRCHPDAKLPVYSTDGAAGFDLFAMEDVVIHPRDWKKIRLGLAFEIPPGWQIEIRPRSGLSFVTSLLAKNTIGTIDSDFRGEVGFCAMNVETAGNDLLISAGDRVCQGVLMPAPRAQFIEAEELSETTRGSGGFGSTGG